MDIYGKFFVKSVYIINWMGINKIILMKDKGR